MGLSEEQIRGYVRRLQLSRMRILSHHGFYGLLLMHMRYGMDECMETAATNGEQILFSPKFLESLSDEELDFVMMHEVLHVVLQHCTREGQRDHERFNIACDIVVNSNILLENGGDITTITLRQWGESMHRAPDGQQGHLFTAEQVYEMLPPTPPRRQKNGCCPPGNGWDDHSRWTEHGDPEVLREVWVKRFADACEAIEIREKQTGRGMLPLFAKRLLGQLTAPQTDWRTILNEFVQPEINDYSFAPPDRRFGESPFFLPDMNEAGQGQAVDHVLFMADASASITDKELAAAFSEVRGAIEQFDGRLKGWLGFFDAGIVPPVEFESVEELMRIRPAGGGGTDFGIIFSYVRKHMLDDPPACIIILTDGYAPFPKEREAMGIPVLWLINNERVDPPWGKVARLSIE